MLEAIFCAFRQHFLKRERKNPLQLKWMCTNKTVPTHKAGNKHTISVLRTSLSAVRAWRQVFTPLEYRCVVHVTYDSSALWMLAISSSPYWLLEKPLKFFSSIKIHLFFLFFFLFFFFFFFFYSKRILQWGKLQAQHGKVRYWQSSDCPSGLSFPCSRICVHYALQLLTKEQFTIYTAPDSTKVHFYYLISFWKKTVKRCLSRLLAIPISSFSH